MESPVPAAYAYKLMLFFIPSTGGKNAAISIILSRHGSWVALIGKYDFVKEKLMEMENAIDCCGVLCCVVVCCVVLCCGVLWCVVVCCVVVCCGVLCCVVL